MTAKDTMYLFSERTFSYNEADPNQEYFVMPCGEYTRNGVRFEITPEDISEFVSNFDAGIPNRPLVTTIEHDDKLGAVGWVKKLIDKGTDGLYATIDWTERGLQLIRDKAFRYLSPEIRWRNYEATDGTLHDRVFFGLAVTNRPWFGEKLALFSDVVNWDVGGTSMSEDFYEHMAGRSGHDLLTSLESVSWLLYLEEERDEPDTEKVNRLTTAKDALKAALEYVVGQFDDEPPDTKAAWDALDAFAAGDTEKWDSIKTEVFAATKTEDGVQYSASAYLVVPDREKPSTWKLRIQEMVDGRKQVTRAQLGRAAAALGPGGFRGQRVQLSSDQRESAKRKLRGQYRKLGVSDDDMPAQLKASDDERPTVASENELGLFSRFAVWLEGQRLLAPKEKQEVDMSEKENGNVEQTSDDVQKESPQTVATEVVEETAKEDEEVPVAFAEMRQKYAEMEKRMSDLSVSLKAKDGEAQRLRDRFDESESKRRTAEFKDTAQENFSALPGTADEIGTMLMWAFDSDTTEGKELYGRFTDMLGGANRVYADQYKERGRTEHESDGDPFMAKVSERKVQLKEKHEDWNDAQLFTEALKQTRKEDPEGASHWHDQRHGRGD